jgi:hypothetical protein
MDMTIHGFTIKGSSYDAVIFDLDGVFTKRPKCMPVTISESPHPAVGGRRIFPTTIQF